MDIKYPSFQDAEFWEEELQRYVECDAHSCGDNGNVWGYFKYCLQTQNRYFFQNPLVPIILERFMANTFVLEANTQLYRARIDHKRRIEEQNWLAKRLKNLQETELTAEEEANEELATSIRSFQARGIKTILDNPEYQEFCKRKSLGFEGFDAKDSGAPPNDVVGVGRCNPDHVAFLYAANDRHTAVAEVRPFIRDAISIATMQVKSDLRLIDLYFEYDENGAIRIEDAFWHKIRSEFSLLNKGNKDEYLITQYIALLAQNAGYDGIRFRSSLVYEGTNYVIFDSTKCIPVSSKMYIIPRVKYTLTPIINEDSD